MEDKNSGRHHLHCEECGKDIEVLNTEYKKSKSKRFFCSCSCAAKYNNRLRDNPSDETRKKISESLLVYHQTVKPRKEYVCRVCGKKYHIGENGSTRMFCSKECLNEYRSNRKKYLSSESISKLSEAGRHSVRNQEENRRSRNEVYFCKLCEEHFANVKHNEPMFNGWDADIIIEDNKMAVLWNGKWHYQVIKKGQSVEQIQNRDRIKIQEIENCGYKPYIIKDMGKYNPKFVEDEFKRFIDIAG